MSSVAGASARGFMSMSSARLLSFGLQMLTFALLAAHLGPRRFGVYTFGVALARLFGVVTNFGFKQVVTRDAAQRPEDERWLLPNYFYIRLALGVVAYAALAGTVSVAGYRPDERDAALVAGLLLVLMAVGSFSAALEVRLRLGWVAIADVAEAVSLLVLVAVLMVADASVLAFVAAYVAVNVLNGVIVLIAALRIGTFSWRPLPSRWGPITRAAIPLGLAAVFSAIYWQIDIVMLARLKPADDVGEYGAAYRMLDALNVIPMMISLVIGPVLSRSVVEGAAVVQRRFAVTIHLVSLLALPVGVLGAILGWRLLPIVPGFGEYERGAIVLSILAPAAGAVFLATIAQALLVSAHEQKVLLRIAAIGAVTNAVVNLALIPSFSLYGAAVATTATELAVLYLSFRILRQRVGATIAVDRVRTAVLAVAAAAVVAVAGYALPALLQAVLAGVAYLVAVLWLGAFRWSDLGGLQRSHGTTVELEALALRRARAACAGAAVCVVRSPDGSVPWRTALGARIGGCGTVLLDIDGDGHRRWLERQLFDDRVSRDASGR